MSHHKRRKPRNQRAGCKQCKPWKINGVGKDKPISEAWSDYKRRQFKMRDMKEDIAGQDSIIVANCREEKQNGNLP